MAQHRPAPELAYLRSFGAPGKPRRMTVVTTQISLFWCDESVHARDEKAAQKADIARRGYPVRHNA